MTDKRALNVSVPHGATFARCEDEPIATPGAIQPHGALVVLLRADNRISHVSHNLEAIVGLSATRALAASPSELAQMLNIDWHRAVAAPEGACCLVAANATDGRALTVQVTTQGEYLFFEFEPATPPDLEVGPLLARVAQHLRRAKTLAEVYQTAVNSVSELTGFDRVAMYIFDAAWHGEVVAERVRQGCVEALGLRFPNTDIPAQARALYAKTAHRAVVDVNYAPVPIIAADARLPPLDLSLCALRSVSPIHRQYLRNFSARASFSGSVMQGARLFGLISCNHEQGPLRVTPERRYACVAVAEMVSTMSERDYTRLPATSPQALAPGLLRKMSRLVDVSKVLLGDAPNMLGVADAHGAAFLYNEEIAGCGDIPPEPFLLRLVAWLRLGQLDDGFFVTDSLPGVFAEAEAHRACACGLLAVTASQDPFVLLLWFRKEIKRQVAWGGEFAKSGETGKSLQPRSSFARWQQAVQLHARTFTDAQVAAGRQLAREVRESIVRQSMGLARANADLERSNRELDAFAHAASHDLKEPLRGVQNFIGMARRELEEGEQPGAIVARLDSVVKLTERMNTLIVALMHYAEVGGNRLDVRPVALEALIQPLLETLRKQPEDRQVTFEVEGDLPTVMADPALLSEVFTNLFTNAIKYNRHAAVRIAVGAAPSDNSDRVTLFVRDNGIGVAPEHHEDVFAIFRRLHGREKFGGGSGTGLTIAKRIVESHGGAMWLKSKIDAGSTFYFSMQRAS